MHRVILGLSVFCALAIGGSAASAQTVRRGYSTLQYRPGTLGPVRFPTPYYYRAFPERDPLNYQYGRGVSRYGYTNRVVITRGGYRSSTFNGYNRGFYQNRGRQAYRRRR